MKRRGLEEEVQTLATRFDSVISLLPAKAVLPILKQIEVLQKRVRPKQLVKGSSLKNQNSGLLKPVRVSEQMSLFAGWDKDELHSRVDVTKAICDYIKKNNLQKQSNKKTILPDEVLQKLLAWNDLNEQAEVVVVAVSDDSEVDAIAFQIQSPPMVGLKTMSYYNNADLTTRDGVFVASIKKLTEAPVPEEEASEIVKFCAVLDKVQEKIQIADTLMLRPSLTYPKIQTRISAHLAESIKTPKKKTKPVPPSIEPEKQLELENVAEKKPAKQPKIVTKANADSENSVPATKTKMVKPTKPKTEKKNKVCLQLPNNENGVDQIDAPEKDDKDVEKKPKKPRSKKKTED